MKFNDNIDSNENDNDNDVNDKKRTMRLEKSCMWGSQVTLLPPHAAAVGPSLFGHGRRKAQFSSEEPSFPSLLL